MAAAAARSVNLGFFAVREDQEAVLNFIFAETDARVFESHSRPDSDLREFRSVDEVLAAFTLGEDEFGNANVPLFRLWSPTVMREPPIRRIDLDPTTRYKYRYTIDGGGVISVRFGGRCGDVITISDVTQMSESAAGAWGVGHGVAWPALQKLANRITYHLKSRLATGKAKGSYVLPKAMELASAGCALKLATQTPWAYSPEPIPRRSKG